MIKYNLVNKIVNQTFYVIMCMRFMQLSSEYTLRWPYEYTTGPSWDKLVRARNAHNPRPKVDRNRLNVLW